MIAADDHRGRDRRPVGQGRQHDRRRGRRRAGRSSSSSTGPSPDAGRRPGDGAASCASGSMRRGRCSRRGTRSRRRPAPPRRPIATIVRPGRSRSSAAERATPIRRLTSDDERRAGRRREPRHRVTGPIRRGRLVRVADDLREPDREEALEGDHREAPEQLDRRPARGGRATTAAARSRRDDARDGPDGAGDRARPAGSRVSVISSVDREHVDHAERRAPRASGSARVGIASNGSSATSPPDSSAPNAMARLRTVLPALSPCSISASGSAASVASTYHASSGPLSSARKTPWSAIDGDEQRDRVGDVEQRRARRARRGSRGSGSAAGRASRTARRSAARGPARRGPGC